MNVSIGDLIAAYILGLIFLLSGLAIIIGNDLIFYKGFIKKEKVPSIGFLIGSIFSVIGIFILFPQKYWWLALIPVLLDYGGIYSLFLLIYLLIRDNYSTRSSK